MSLFTDLFRRRPHPAWSKKTIIRYILFQIPAIVLLSLVLFLLRSPLDLPLWSILLILSLWMLKDFLMFFFVWRAYVPSGAEDPGKMTGKTGQATQDFNPGGYVRIEGELWYAESHQPQHEIKSGDAVVVREIHGLTLFVEQKRSKGQRI